MKKLIFAPLFFVQLLAAQTLVLDTFDFGGFTRDYQLYIPTVYDGSQAVPLVINMHGYGSNAGQQNFYGSFDDLAEIDNFLVVHPNGTLDLSGTPYWNAFVSGGAVDDVAYISALIDSLSALYNIDQSKVFATGMRNGGFMSYRLACELNNRIAKIASVTGTMNVNLPSTCFPTAPIPVMQIHGTNDPTVPYAGNAAFVPIEDVVRFWVDHNNCDSSAIFTALPNIDLNDNSTVERYEYLNGDNNAEVIFYKVIGGTHTWPGAQFLIPGSVTNQDFSASKVIWEFFKGAPVTGVKEPLKNDNLAIVQTTNKIMFELNEFNNAAIVNALGQVMIQTQENNINIQHLSAGVYFLVVSTEKGFYSKTFVK